MWSSARYIPAVGVARALAAHHDSLVQVCPPLPSLQGSGRHLPPVGVGENMLHLEEKVEERQLYLCPELYVLVQVVCCGVLLQVGEHLYVQGEVVVSS